MINEAKAIIDFEDSEPIPELHKDLIQAIKDKKKLYPVKISLTAEYDEVMLFLSTKDKDGFFYNMGTISISSNDFNALMSDAGYKPDLGYYDKMSEDEKKDFEKEIKEDYKDKSITHPFEDKVKEMETSN